jgi:hypothetical protein
MEEEIEELQEIEYKQVSEEETPDDMRWEDQVTDALNTLIRYVKEVAEKRD